MLTLALTAQILTALVGLPVLALLRRLKAVQTISEFVPEHQAKQGTPTMGGLMMVTVMLALGFAVPAVGWPVVADPPWAFAALVVGFALIGFLDDFVLPRWAGTRGLGWVPKLILQFAVAGPVCWFVFSSHAGWRLDGLGAVASAAIVVVALANAVNMTDGLDGLAAGTTALAALGLWGGGAAPLIPGLLLGVCAGFLIYNLPPARVFMGDVGSLPLGAAFGFALLDTPRVNPWSILLCGVFLIELIPVPIQIASVKLFKRRVFPRTPIHHAFQHAGVPERRVTAGFVLAQAACTLLYVVLAR